MSKGCEQHTFL